MRIAETGEITMEFKYSSQGGKYDRYEGVTKSGRIVVQYLPAVLMPPREYKTIITIETTAPIQRQTSFKEKYEQQGDKQIELLTEIASNLKVIREDQLLTVKKK